MAPNGSIVVDGQSYDHPLAYIEAGHKTEGEWQIRAVPKQFGAGQPLAEFGGTASVTPPR